MSEKQGQIPARRLLKLWSFWIILTILGIPTLLLLTLNFMANRHAFHGDEKEMPRAWRELIEKEEAAARAVNPHMTAPAPPVLPWRVDTQTSAQWAGVGDLPRQLDDKSSLTLGWQKVTHTTSLSDPDSCWNLGRSLDWKIRRWLEEHGDLIESMLAFEESGQLPLIKESNGAWWPYEWNWMHEGHQVLSAEMQRRWEAVDRAGTWRIAEASMRFTETIHQRLAYPGVKTYGIYNDWEDWKSQLEWMLKVDLLNPDLQDLLRLILAERHRDFSHFTGDMIDSIRDGGLMTRQGLIWMLNSPWNSQFYLAKSSWTRRDYAMPIGTRSHSIDIVRYDLMAWDALAAMQNARLVKCHAQAMLEEYDAFVLATLRYTQLSYPEMVTQTQPEFPWHFPYPAGCRLFDKRQFLVLQHKVVSCLNEAQLNLVRAALDYRRGGLPPTGGDNLNMRNDPENPWRDPFTDRPFRIVQETSATLIYSPGPDLKDQGGKVECVTDNYSNYTYWMPLPKGDLTIRLPH